MTMRSLKKWAALLLASSLALSACGPGGAQEEGQGASSGGAQTAAVMGRYIEEEHAFPEEVKIIMGGLLETSDGGLEVLASSSEANIVGPWSFWASKDGNSWTKRETPWLGQFDDAMIDAIGAGSDGTVYLAATVYTDEFQALLDEALETGVVPSQDQYPVPAVYRIAPDGTAEVCEIEMKRSSINAGSPFSIGEILVAESGDLLVSYYDGADNSEIYYQYDKELKKVHEFISGGDSAVTFGQTLAVATDGGIEQFDLSTGETLESIPFDASASHGVISMSRDGKSFFRCDASGIYRYVLGGSVWERVVDGELTSLGMPSVWISGVAELDESFFVLSSSGGGYAPLTFRYSADTPAVPDKELVVYSLADNDTVRQAVGLFQRQYPDIRVRVNVAVDPDSAATSADAIRSLGTELLAGKGPDVLVLDGLPIDSYIEKGVLADLSGVRSLISGGSLVEKIARTYRAGDALYAVPLRFGVPLMWGPDDLIAGAKDLTGLADWVERCHAANPDRRALYHMEPEDLIRDFYATCAPAWRGEDGGIDTALVARFLTDVKRIADAAVPPQLDESTMITAELYEFYGDAMYQAIYWANGYISAAMDLTRQMGDLATPDAAIQYMGKGGGMALMPGQAQGVYVPMLTLGVNKNSALAEQAAAFVETALSERVQTLGFGDGYPVSRKALEQNIRSPYPEGDDGIQAPVYDEEGRMHILQILWPEESFMRQFLDTIDTLSVPSTVDEDLLGMVVDETRDFFSGGKSAEDAAAAVAQRAQAYLSE